MPSLSIDYLAESDGGIQNRSSLWRVIHAMGIARLAWTACGLSIAVLASIALLVHRADLAQVMATMDADVSLNAKGYAKFVGLSISIVDRELAELREDHLKGVSLPLQTALSLNLAALKGLVLQVAVADANGLVVDSTLGKPKQTISIADRPHFLAVKNNPLDKLFISQPVLGRVSNKLSLQLLRPILTPEGRFDGVIVASIDPEILKSYFTDLKAVENQGALTILGTDGFVRFRLDENGFSAGQDLRASPRLKELIELSSGLFEQKSSLDGIQRRLAHHKVEGYPLVVVAGKGIVRSTENFKVRWKLIWSLALALAVVLMLVAGTIARLAVEQKKSFTLMQQNRERALQNNRTQSNFLASVSHELRTPLNSILGFSELIRDTGIEPKISQYADLIHKSGTHLHALVNTILDLTKIESGHMKMTLEPIDMPQLLQTLVAIHKVNADEKNVELSVSLDNINEGWVESDRTKLTQVLNNVIHNAIKFTPLGGIFVVMKPSGTAGLMISVTDTGIGIAADKTAQVFERFNTIDAPVGNSGIKGTGLGLALCRELLFLMDGTITLSSEEGIGTTVDIFVPFKIPAQG